VLIDTDQESTRIARRADIAAAAVGEIGMPVLRLPVPASTDPLARLLAGAGGLQALTLELVRARRVNPDLIRREEEPYRRAGAAGDSDW
jgi:glutamine---fructose-6-phosphate transaminase (isomerizing)